MPDDARILSARRSYEFGRDDLRLTMLSSPEVRQEIQQQFSFEIAQVAKPAQSFGPVPNSIPPGLVFDVGTARLPEGSALVPIRFLHFETFRIVIDAVGPSSAIDEIFDQIGDLVSEFKMPDGSPIIDEPSNVVEYSEISAHFGFDFDALVDRAFLGHVQKLFDHGQDPVSMQPMAIRFSPRDGANESADLGFTLEVRGGTRPEERTYFSAANVGTEQHLAWLDALDQDLSGG